MLLDIYAAGIRAGNLKCTDIIAVLPQVLLLLNAGRLKLAKSKSQIMQCISLFPSLTRFFGDKAR